MEIPARIFVSLLLMRTPVRNVPSLESLDTFESLAGRKLTLNVDHFTKFLFPKSTHGIKIFQGEPERVHSIVTGATKRTFPSTVEHAHC